MDLAAEVAATVAQWVMAGKISPVEETKAGVAAASVLIELTRAERELEAARKRLAWRRPGAALPHASSAP